MALRTSRIFSSSSTTSTLAAFICKSSLFFQFRGRFRPLPSGLTLTRIAWICQAPLPHRFETDEEDRPLTGNRFHPDAPPVIPDDALADGQPQTNPPLLGRKKGGEYL